MGRRRFFYASAAALLVCVGLSYVHQSGLLADHLARLRREATQAVPVLREIAATAGTERRRYSLVPILCFHNIDGKGPYSVSRAEFRGYLERIRDNGITVIPLRELQAAAEENRLLDRPSIVITIDDDYKNIVRVGAPLLREFRYPATFFFYTIDIMNDPRWGTSWDDLRRLYDEGFDVQNHSYTHTIFHIRLPGESRAEYDLRVHREIYTSREILQQNLPDAELYAFAYPMGYFSADLRSRLENAGYELLLTTDSNPVDLTKPFTGTFDRYTIQKRFVKNPEAMFQLQLQYALSPHESGDVAAD